MLPSVGVTLRANLHGWGACVVSHAVPQGQTGPTHQQPEERGHVTSHRAQRNEACVGSPQAVHAKEPERPWQPSDRGVPKAARAGRCEAAVFLEGSGDQEIRLFRRIMHRGVGSGLGQKGCACQNERKWDTLTGGQSGGRGK